MQKLQSRSKENSCIKIKKREVCEVDTASRLLLDSRNKEYLEINHENEMLGVPMAIT